MNDNAISLGGPVMDKPLKVPVSMEELLDKSDQDALDEDLERISRTRRDSEAEASNLMVGGTKRSRSG
jgi:hypothetical protein